jgi:hypothetical protein
VTEDESSNVRRFLLPPPNSASVPDFRINKIVPASRSLRLGSLGSKIATGFEIKAAGALELAFFFIKLCPAVRAGAFDLFERIY